MSLGRTAATSATCVRPGLAAKHPAVRQPENDPLPPAPCQPLASPASPHDPIPPAAKRGRLPPVSVHYLGKHHETGQIVVTEALDVHGEHVYLGWRIRLTQRNGLRAWQLIGPAITPDDPLVKMVPGWNPSRALTPTPNWRLGDIIKDLPVPRDMNALRPLPAPSSLPTLARQIVATPSLWCDGGYPDQESPAAWIQNAGELLAVALGLRGMGLIQLASHWQGCEPLPQIYNPLALEALRVTLATPGVKVLPSPHMKDPATGVTAVVYADKSPWREWAVCVADSGAQSSLSGDSPEHRVALGTMLGYKWEHIVSYVHHFDGTSQPTQAVIDYADNLLRGLSPKEPVLPWKPLRTANKKSA